MDYEQQLTKERRVKYEVEHNWYDFPNRRNNELRHEPIFLEDRKEIEHFSEHTEDQPYAKKQQLFLDVLAFIALVSDVKIVLQVLSLLDIINDIYQELRIVKSVC